MSSDSGATPQSLEATHLVEMGLSEQEVALIGLARQGAEQPAARVAAKELLESMWSVAPTKGVGNLLPALLMAVLAGLAAKFPAVLLPEHFDQAHFYLLNSAFLVLPFVVALFAVTERPSRKWLLGLAGVVVALAVLVNIASTASTETLVATHLPVVLWFLVGLTRVGSHWRETSARLDFLRFSGDTLVYYALFALAGGLLMGISVGVFSSFYVDIAWFVSDWVLILGASGALVIAAALASSRARLVSAVVGVLQKIFTPLFTLLLLSVLVTAWSATAFEREALAMFDALLLVVTGLVAYAIATRDLAAKADLHDWLLLALTASAVLVDVYVLTQVAGRIVELGLSPNRLAVVVLNLLLLGFLAVVARYLVNFNRGLDGYVSLVRWQAIYLPVFGVWAAVVVVVFPIVFRS